MYYNYATYNCTGETPNATGLPSVHDSQNVYSLLVTPELQTTPIRGEMKNQETPDTQRGLLVLQLCNYVYSLMLSEHIPEIFWEV